MPPLITTVASLRTSVRATLWIVIVGEVISMLAGSILIVLSPTFRRSP
jgi:hypothetical protein